jgi:MerR family transcriptional regulator, light-induced transcriptional regulator
LTFIKRRFRRYLVPEKIDPKFKLHPIQVVAYRTGLSPEVLRAWEKRYAAITPTRTVSNRRLYSDSDIERLLLLRRAISSGRSIGQIAHLSTPQLTDLVGADEKATQQAPVTPTESAPAFSIERHLVSCIRAVENLDAVALEFALARAAVALSRTALLERLLVSLLERVGELWSEGSLRIAHEHVASAIVRTFLGELQESAAASPAAPRLAVTTPAGQRHEFGALIAAAVAASEGWAVTYLGPDLPAAEIAAGALRLNVKAVALSIVYASGEPLLRQELTELRQRLPDEVALIVGGRATDAYRDLWREIRAIKLEDMRGLRAELASRWPK